MTMKGTRFRRVVVSFAQPTPRQTVRVAADLARHLRLELLGLFIEDARLRALGNLRFLREFRLSGDGWQPIDISRLEAELDLSRRSAERVVAGIAGEFGAISRFEVAGGQTGVAAEGRFQNDDLVVFGGGTAGFAIQRPVAEALCSAAAVVLVPPRLIRIRGVIAVFRREADDPVVRVASLLAEALGEELTRLDLPPDERAGSPLLAALSKLKPLRERMVVLPWQDNGALAERIATLRGVPVLIVDGGAYGPNHGTST